LRNFIGHDLTFEECVEKAREKNQYYIGFQYGNECWADTNIGMFEKVNDEDCLMPCSKDKDKNCGGSWRNLVYDLRQLDAQSKTDCLIRHETRLDTEHKKCHTEG